MPAGRRRIIHSFKKRHKYGVSPKDARTVDGITFDSKAEAGRYLELKRLRDEGSVVQFLRQNPSVQLPGKSRYVADFMVFWSDGAVTIEDVKGFRTAEYRRKKKVFEEEYAPLTITEIEVKR